MPDLCPKGIDLGVTPSGPSYPPTLLDEMEDRRQRDKEKQVSPIYPWDHIHRAARDTEEQPHKLSPLHEAPIRRNNQSMRVNKPFSYQEIQKIKEDLGDYLEEESLGKREDEITALPTGNQVVPTTELDWDYNTAKGRWDQSHFVRCVLEGLRQLCAKPLSYGKLADTEQEEKEAPGKF